MTALTPDSGLETCAGSGYPSSPHVGILMGTRNGEAYLAEQLDSIAGQTHGNWSLWLSDESDEPGTRMLAQRYREKWGQGRLHIRRGPNRGFAANFLGLLGDPCIQADVFAFADQDDIWYPDKLQRGVDALARVPAGVPALYAGRSRLVNGSGQPLGFSSRPRRPLTFANALVQNVAAGNTMMLNQAARDTVNAFTGGEVTGLHDWWTYLAITGVGGRMMYDSRPVLDYRQHTANLIGMQTGCRRLWSGARRFFRGEYREALSANLAALAPHVDKLSEENRHAYRHFCAARAGQWHRRLIEYRRSGVYRQTRPQDIFLAAGILFARA